MPNGERFADVCGSIDELKRSLYEDPSGAVAEAGRLVALVEEALRMEERMERRLLEYEAFGAGIAALSYRLGSSPSSRRAAALTAAPELVHLLGLGRPLAAEERDRAAALAEEIRASAVGLEQSLYRYKEAALALERAYRAIRGARAWVLDEEEARSVGQETLPEEWGRWLPPSPHRERILRYLRVGRAHLTADGVGRSPLVQFEDGGLISLSAVRWSEEVRNFHHVDSPPHPNGLRYRA